MLEKKMEEPNKMEDFIMVSRSYYEKLVLKANNVNQNPEPHIKQRVQSDYYYNTEEVMEMLKVSRPTIKNWRDAGILPYRKFGRKVRFKKEDIEKLEHKMAKRGICLSGGEQWKS